MLIKLLIFLLKRRGYKFLYGSKTHTYLFVKSGDKKEHYITLSGNVVFEDHEPVSFETI